MKRHYQQIPSLYPILPHSGFPSQHVDLRPYYIPHWGNTNVGEQPLGHNYGGAHVPGIGGHGTYSGPQYTSHHDETHMPLVPELHGKYISYISDISHSANTRRCFDVKTTLYQRQ